MTSTKPSEGHSPDTALALPLESLIVLAGAMTACQDDQPPGPTTAEVRSAVDAALRDDTVDRLRLPNGSRPSNLAELEQARIPTANGGLPLTYDEAVRKDASKAGEDFAGPVNERVKDTFRIATYELLLRHGLLDPDTPAASPPSASRSTPRPARCPAPTPSARAASRPWSHRNGVQGSSAGRPAVS